MGNRFKSVLGILCVVSMLTATVSHAFSLKGDANVSNIKERLQKEFGITFSSIKAMEIPGLYEIVAGPEIFYYFEKTDWIFQGAIYDKENNITEMRKAELAAEKLKTLPLDKAMKIGSGKNIVVEFSDPDCPYCRKAAEFLDARSDVTRYVFWSPLPIHPDAPKKAAYILCEKDQAAAYTHVIKGNLDSHGYGIDKSCEAVAAKTVDGHLQIAASMGVRGTPDFYINGEHVVGANINRIKELLDEKK